MQVQFVQASNIGLYLERIGIPLQRYKSPSQKDVKSMFTFFLFLISF